MIGSYWIPIGQMLSSVLENFLSVEQYLDIMKIADIVLSAPQCIAQLLSNFLINQAIL